MLLEWYQKATMGLKNQTPLFFLLTQNSPVLPGKFSLRVFRPITEAEQARERCFLPIFGKPHFLHHIARLAVAKPRYC